MHKNLGRIDGRGPAASGSWRPPAVELIGSSQAILRLKAAARAVAERSSTIMLLGETGSGKEMIARYIHRHSPRADKPFIAVDCSAMSESLFESQMFGHVRGSFTGALRDTLGFVRAADHGTLFLDEIGELPLNLQAKLLRVIQERCTVPVGETEPVPVDLRIICATNRDLRGMVADNLFRQDLFYRLNVIALNVPPLRQRTDDILPLAEYFLDRQAELVGEPRKQLSEPAAQCLARFPWPGNIRELFNAMEHAHVLCGGPIIQITDLPHPLCDWRQPDQDNQHELNLQRVERQTIVEALRRTRFNRAAACRFLGVEKRRLNRRIAQLRISLPTFPTPA